MNRYTFIAKIGLGIWAKLVKNGVICPNLKYFLATAHAKKEWILRELLTLFPMVYESIYFYCQNWSRDLGKVGQKRVICPNLKYFLATAHAKKEWILRELLTLFPMVYESIYFYCQNWPRDLGKVGQKRVICPNLKYFLATAHAKKERILRELLTLFPMVYESIYFYCQNWPRDLGKVGQKRCHLPKPKIFSGDRTLKVKADSKRTFDALSNGI
jgi:hypothetical protein